MTESCSCITDHPPEKYDYKYGHTVGTICANTEIKVIDLDGNELGLDEPGEVRMDSTTNNGLADLIPLRRFWLGAPKSPWDISIIPKPPLKILTKTAGYIPEIRVSSTGRVC